MAMLPRLLSILRPRTAPLLAAEVKRELVGKLYLAHAEADANLPHVRGKNLHGLMTTHPALGKVSAN